MFEALNLPPAPLKLTRSGEQILVFCVIRKKKLIVTPEEWVRQHVIHYLIHQKQIAPSRIASEVLIKVGSINRRVDVLVYDAFKNPELLIECKATHVKLDTKVIQQVIHYNSVLKVPKIAITNGLKLEIIQIDYETNAFHKLEDF